jgi:mRNA-degrading endonuclease toxin of MazEF toxin-antitoxin module
MSLMQAGDVVRIDFGNPARGEAGFVRPAVIVTSNDVLEFRQSTIVVVPCSTTDRGWITDVPITGFGVAQAHLPTTISVDRIVDGALHGLRDDASNVGPVVLRQIRELIADLLEIGR